MKKGLALIAATSLAAVAAPAFAQDGSFSGPWVAGVAGYDVNKAGSSQDSAANPNRHKSAKGVVYGGAVGYDADLGNVVVGGEAELTDSSADSKYDNNFVDYGLGSVDAGRDIYVGGRVGFKAIPEGRASMPGPVDYSRLLVAELVDGAFANVSGAIRPDWSVTR